jgi:spore cortex biosynthesis protein YabQ
VIFLEVSVYNQAFVFICFILGGFTIGFFYSFLQVIIQVLGNKAITFILDLFFWLSTAIIIFILVFITNNGELRWYEFLGALLGIILYNMLLGNIVKDILLKIFHIVRLVVYNLMIIVIWPFKQVYFLAKAPFKFMQRFMLLRFRYTKRKVKNLDNKIFMFSKRINMFVKKI